MAGLLRAKAVLLVALVVMAATIANGAKDLKDKNAPAAAPIGTRIKDEVKGAGNKIKDGAKGAGNKIKDGAKGAGDKIKDGAKGAGKKVKDGADKVKDEAKKGAGKVKETAAPIGNKLGFKGSAPAPSEPVKGVKIDGKTN